MGQTTSKALDGHVAPDTVRHLRVERLLAKPARTGYVEEALSTLSAEERIYRDMFTIGKNDAGVLAGTHLWLLAV
eukprot:12344911-Prorocentrum_lima.AAC.1